MSYSRSYIKQPRHRYKSELRSDAILDLFFDFYTLNEIWFRTMGAQEYGYPVTKILPYAKEKAIDETFKSKVALLKRQIIEALELSVRGEIKHWGFETRETEGAKLDEYNQYIPGTSIFDRLCNQIGYDQEDSWKRRCSFLAKLPLETIRTLFFAKCWYRGYGGKRWGEATDLLIQLKNSKNIKDDVYLIDRIFDLQHNTGFVLNKTVFVTLDCKGEVQRKHKNGRWYGVKPLNYRFTASLKELALYSSRHVRNLYTANLRFIGA